VWFNDTYPFGHQTLIPAGFACGDFQVFFATVFIQALFVIQLNGIQF